MGTPSEHQGIGILSIPSLIDGRNLNWIRDIHPLAVSGMTIWDPAACGGALHKKGCCMKKLVIISAIAVFALGNLSCKDAVRSKSDPLVLELNPTHVSVYGGTDGSINLTVTGGVKPYEYEWSSGETTEDISNLVIGKYSAIVTDADGRIKADSAIIIQPAELMFNSEEVTFTSENLVLSGTLNLPNDVLKVSAVIIAAGAGQDQNGIYPPDPNLCPPIYKTWADTVAQHGIAVLRYDQRIAQPYISRSNFSLNDRVTDIKSAVNYLKSRSEIDTSKIYIIGHSEGGAAAPVAAQIKNTAKGLILIAVAAFAADTMLIERFKAADANPDYIDDVVALFARLRSGEYSRNWEFNNLGTIYTIYRKCRQHCC